MELDINSISPLWRHAYILSEKKTGLCFGLLHSSTWGLVTDVSIPSKIKCAKTPYHASSFKGPYLHQAVLWYEFKKTEGCIWSRFFLENNWIAKKKKNTLQSHPESIRNLKTLSSSLKGSLNRPRTLLYSNKAKPAILYTVIISQVSWTSQVWAILDFLLPVHL